MKESDVPCTDRWIKAGCAEPMDVEWLEAFKNEPNLY